MDTLHRDASGNRERRAGHDRPRAGKAAPRLWFGLGLRLRLLEGSLDRGGRHPSHVDTHRGSFHGVTSLVPQDAVGDH